MITAALAATAAVSDNQTAVVWLILAALAVFGIVAVLWQHETVSDRHRRVINEHDELLNTHDEQLATLAYQMPALLEHLGVEIAEPVEDDSPEAMTAEEEFDPATVTAELPPNPTRRVIATVPYPDDAQTDEIPIAPPTVPDGIPLAVQSALLEHRPSPVPRGKSADWVEEAIKGFDFSGRNR